MGVRNGEDILLAQRCWWGYKLFERHIWRQDTQCLPLRMRTHAYTIVKAKYFYECESDNLCINMYTPPKRMMGRGNIQNVYIIFL